MTLFLCKLRSKKVVMLQLTISKPKKCISVFCKLFLMKSKPDDERMTRFSDYLVDVFIRDEAQHPLEIWELKHQQSQLL